MVKDELKMKVINWIDGVDGRFKRTDFQIDLKKMRDKYIYKDISWKEFMRDAWYLKNLNDLI